MHRQFLPGLPGLVKGRLAGIQLQQRRKWRDGEHLRELKDTLAQEPVSPVCPCARLGWEVKGSSPSGMTWGSLPRGATGQGAQLAGYIQLCCSASASREGPVTPSTCPKVDALCPV